MREVDRVKLEVTYPAEEVMWSQQIRTQGYMWDVIQKAERIEPELFQTDELFKKLREACRLAYLSAMGAQRMIVVQTEA